MAESRPTKAGALAGWSGQPYRVPLPSAAAPEAVIAGLEPADRPAVLWGGWFGGGALLLRRPLRRSTPATAVEAFSHLEDQPRLTGSPPELVGGGWVATLGYASGATAVAFYDSLLRWRGKNGWAFESLGLRGREAADAAALDHWRRLLTAPPGAPVAGRPEPIFTTESDAGATRTDYLGAVEDVIGRIHRGDFYQLNLCLRLRAPSAEPVPALFARTAAELRPAYAALVSGPAMRMVASLSPELFLRVRGRQVTTSPIKGTAPRTRTGAATLRASAKDAAENVMIVDLMRNDLSRVCRPGTVTVDDLLDIQPHPGVWHLVSTVHGELADGVGTADLLRATFPPGSVTGAPKGAAVQAIAELEPEPRGAYTGSLGLVSPLAGTDLNVLIRTFETDQDGLQLGVGGGITADSVPVREWYECLHKAAPLVAAVGGRLAPALAEEPGPPDPDLLAAGVFETVLVAYGEPVRLAGHLARLDRSVRELYGRGLPAALPARATAHLAELDPVPRRALRVTVRPHSGRLTIELHSRPLGPRLPSSTLVLGTRPDRSWRHKWIDRAALEQAARESAPAFPYFTAAGSVTETDRGNLFWLDAAGRWCTPPLDEQVLPGVTRREVLDLLAEDQTPVTVRRATPAELRQAAGAFWTSSLSGAVAVSAVDGTPLPDRSAYTVELSERLGVGR
jgi:para-aminobenzoate synthetase/4-amino-4-deoxychorismate lyase